MLFAEQKALEYRRGTLNFSILPAACEAGNVIFFLRHAAPWGASKVCWGLGLWESDEDTKGYEIMKL